MIEENEFCNKNIIENIKDDYLFQDVTFDACKFNNIDFTILNMKNCFFIDCIFEN